MLNLPTSFFLQVKNYDNILLSAINTDSLFSSLPIYYALRKLGKNVHLAVYSQTDFQKMPDEAQPVVVSQVLIGANSIFNKNPGDYYPEGDLAKWLKETQKINTNVWMFRKTGANQLRISYKQLIERFKAQAIILVDNNFESLIQLPEDGFGKSVDGHINLASLNSIEIPKFLISTGFGVEKRLSYYNILKNISNVNKQGGLFGSCSLLNFMNCFKFYKDAIANSWNESEYNNKIIGAAEGEFVDDETIHLISPLINQYWFFNGDAIIYNNQLISYIEDSVTYDEAMQEIFPRIQAVIGDRKFLPY